MSSPPKTGQVGTGVRRTLDWIERCMKAHGRPHDQALFPIVQGSVYPELREQCAAALVAMDAPGYAIGGGHVLHVVSDLTIAADNAVFGQTGPLVGSFDGGFGAAPGVESHAGYVFTSVAALAVGGGLDLIGKDRWEVTAPQVLSIFPRDEKPDGKMSSSETS